MERIQAAIQKAKRQRELAGEVAPRPLQKPRTLESSDAWEGLPKINLDAVRMDAHRIVTFNQIDSAHFTFDTMRAKLLRALRQNGWTTVGITSPQQQCGKTMVCLNLAFSLAHQPESRIVVCDLDLRQPKIADTLGAYGEHSIDSFLKGQSPMEKVFRCYGGGLALGLCNRPADDPAELLQSKNATIAMKEIREKLDPDVVLVDLPPMLVADDVMGFLPNLDGVLLIAAAEATTIEHIDKCVQELSEHTNILGVVLNKCPYPNESSGYYGNYY